TFARYCLVATAGSSSPSGPSVTQPFLIHFETACRLTLHMVANRAGVTRIFTRSAGSKGKVDGWPSSCPERVGSDAMSAWKPGRQPKFEAANYPLLAASPPACAPLQGGPVSGAGV